MFAELVDKWQRDAHLSVARRLRKASSYAGDRAWARWHLRRAEVGAGTRAIGRPILRAEGRIVMGAGCWLRSILAPVELTATEQASLLIGDGCEINSGTTICAFSKVEIGDRVLIAPFVSIYDTNFHDLYDRRLVPEPKPVVIEDDVWLCAKCTILPGVRIGRGAVVAAHALVRDDVEPFTVVSGVPAQVVQRLDPARFVVPSS